MKVNIGKIALAGLALYGGYTAVNKGLDKFTERAAYKNNRRVGYPL